MRYLISVLLSALIIVPLLSMDGCKQKEATEMAPATTTTQPGEMNAPSGGMNAPAGGEMNAPGGK